MATIIKIEESPSQPTESPEMNDIKIENSRNEDQQQQQLSQPEDHPWEQPVVLAKPTTIRVKKGFQVVNNSGGVFPCKICPRQFSMAGYLVNHMQREHTAGKFICETCGRKFEEEEELVTHILHLHFHKDDYFIQTEYKGEMKYKCKYCDKLVNNKSKAEIHEASHVEFSVRTRRFEAKNNQQHLFHCLRCTRKFALENFLEDHVRTEHACDRHPCVECGRSFRTLPDLAKHKAYYELKPKFSDASDAAKEIAQLEDITRFSKSKPISTTNEERPKPATGVTAVQYNCAFCAQTLNTKTAYHEHLRQKHGEMMRLTKATTSVEESNCKICEVLSKGECDDDYFQHIRNSHTASTKTIKCGVCSKEFPSTDKLKGHMLFHEVKAWKCIYCQNTFPDVKTLKSHMEEQHGHLKTNGVFTKGREQQNFLSLTEAKRKAAAMVAEEANKANNSTDPQLPPWLKKAKVDYSTMSTPFSEGKKTKDVAGGGRGDEMEGGTSKESTRANDGVDQLLYSYDEARRTFVCNACPVTRDRRCFMQDHVEIHRNGEDYVCGLCQERTKHLFTLRQHMKQAHGMSKIGSNLQMVDSDNLQLIGSESLRMADNNQLQRIGSDNTQKAGTVKIEDLSNASHQSALPVGQRITILSGEPVSNKTSDNMIPIKYELIEKIETVDTPFNYTVDTAVKTEAVHEPELVIVKSEIEDNIVLLE